MAERTYWAAVELFAMLYVKFVLDPLGDGVIVSHAEGYKRGIASYNGDSEHLWRQLGQGYYDKHCNDILQGKDDPSTPAEDFKPFWSGYGLRICISEPVQERTLRNLDLYRHLSVMWKLSMICIMSCGRRRK